MKRKMSTKTIENQGSGAHRMGYRNRIISFILCVIMAVCLVPVMGKTEEVNAVMLPGDGTAEKPYRISNYAQLKEFANIVNGQNQTACAILTGDIYCRNSDSGNYATDWVPIGNSSRPFKGEFYGNNKKIIGLNNTDSGTNSDNQGLFGYVGETGKVCDVGIEESNIVGVDCVGAIAGCNEGQITGCYNTGKVTGSLTEVGGVAGFNCKTVTGCYNSGEITGGKYTGGVIGNFYGTPDAEIINCYNTGKVTGSSDYVGGVAGYVNKKITTCYNTGAVTGTGDNSLVGGIAGYSLEATNCYNTGMIKGKKYVGGVVGGSTGFVKSCYNIGEVTGTDDNSIVGGIGGYCTELTKCYNTGMIMGTHAGGVVGEFHNSYSCIATYCFYDKSSSMVSKAIGSSESDSGTAIGLTTAQMTGADALSSTNTNFDFGNEGNSWLVKADYSNGDTTYWYYPHLRGFNFGSEGQQSAAADITPDAWPAKITTTVEPAGALSAEYNGNEQTLPGNVVQNAITVPTGFIPKYCKYTNGAFGAESTEAPTVPGLYKVILYKNDAAVESHLFKILENGTDKDYTIAYYKKTGTDAESRDPVWSTDTVTVKDAGDYKAVISFTAKPNESISKELEITPKSINVSANANSKVYGESDPTLTYTYDVTDLIGSDALTGNISRVSGENAGQYDIEKNTLAAGNNYTINFTGAKFTIKPKSLGSDAVRLSAGELDYAGTAVAPEVTVYDGESEVPASEYTVNISNNVNSGTATVEVLDVANGNYTVNGTKTFDIKKAKVNVTALPQTVKQDSAILTGTESAVLTGAASGHYLSSVILNSTSTSAKTNAGTITASSAVIKDAAGNDVTRNYDISYNTGVLTVIGKKSYTITFRVINGAWDDGTKNDKTVILTGYEGDGLKLAGNDIPSVGNKPDDNYKSGAWDVIPTSDTEITSDVTYIYNYTKIEYKPVQEEVKEPEQKQYPYSVKDVLENQDGSITTTTITYFEDGSITELVEREWLTGKKKGRKNTKVTEKDPDGKVISITMETLSFSKKQTKTETKDIKKADGYTFRSTVKTYKSGKQVSTVTITSADGVKQEYTEKKYPDGPMTRKTKDTTADGKISFTITTVALDESSSSSGEPLENNKKLVETVTKYKVTGKNTIKLTSLKTDGDKVIIPKTISFDGKKYTVAALGKKMFKKAEGIKEIYIYSEGLKKIYAGAFTGVPADVKFYIKATATNCKKIVRMIKKSGFGKVDYTKI
jgi:hypothetical protein